jgi:hypothetical protein
MLARLSAAAIACTVIRVLAGHAFLISLAARRPLAATAARRWRRITGPLLACPVMFAALVMVGCGGPAAPTEPPHPPRCASLLFVGARGSGEDPSQQLAMGTTVYPVYAGVRAADPQVAGYGWPYKGERPGITELRHDAAELDGFLNTRARHCPTERIILAGYSAGALIIGDALQSPALTAAARGRVTAAVMLADPEFNPTDRHTAAGTFDPRYGGAPRRAAFAAPLTSRIRSYCRRHDIVCQRRDRAANKDQHGNYVPQQTGQAINFIERTADLRRTKS